MLSGKFSLFLSLANIDQTRDPVREQVEASLTATQAHQDETQEPVRMQVHVNFQANFEETQGPVRGQVRANLPSSHEKYKLHKNSYIDNLTLLEKISMKILRQKDKLIGPLDFHDRHNLTIPPST